MIDNDSDDFESAGITDAMMDHPMWDPLVELVALAATYDQRKAGALDVKAWFLVAQVERWDVAAVQRVIVEHYARDPQRLTAAAVSLRLREIRRAAAATFEDPIIPDELPARDYPEWYRAQRDAHVARCVTAWAATGEEPRHGAITANRVGTIGDLVAAAPESVRPAIEAGVRKIAEHRP